MKKNLADIWSGSFTDFCKEDFRDTHVHVYMLYERESSGMLRLYIGETMNEKKRIPESLKRFPDIDRVHIVLIKFLNEITDKRCRTYIEGRLYFAFRRHPLFCIINNPRMASASLCGVDTNFLEAAEVGIKLAFVHFADLGFDTIVPEIATMNSHELEFEMRVLHRGQIVYADAYIDDGHWVVRKGSTARHRKYGTKEDGHRIREQLIGDGLLGPCSRDLYRFRKDIAFSHANISASVINGDNACGKSRWLVRGHGMPLGETGHEFPRRKGRPSFYKVWQRLERRVLF